jgi:hypothetical protein
MFGDIEGAVLNNSITVFFIDVVGVWRWAGKSFVVYYVFGEFRCMKF